MNKDATSPQFEFRDRLWLALCAIVAIALIIAARTKGGYIDEYWTISFADSTVPLPHAFEAWSMETGHGIGFYALSRIGDMLLPRDLFARRLSNLVYLAAALAFAWFGKREQRPFGLLYVAALAASPYVVERFAEYRAIFAALMVIAILVLRVRNALLVGRPTPANTALIAVLMAMLALLDYPSAIAGLALGGAWGLLSLFRRDWNAVVAAGIANAACVITIVLSIANAARFKMYPSPYFQPFSGLVSDLAVVIATAILPCLAMLLFAALGLRREEAPLRRAAIGTPFLQILMLAALFTIAGFIVFNAGTHSLIRRQIFAIVPLVVAFLTELSFPYLKPRPLIAASIGLNLLIVSAGTALALKSKRNFDRYGPEMAQAQQSCAALPIYPVLPEKIVGVKDNRFPMRDQVEIGFQDIAQRYDLRLRSVPRRGWIDPGCGAILWSEYLWLNQPPTPAMIVARLGLEADPETLAAARTQYVDQSMLIRVPPPRPR